MANVSIEPVAARTLDGRNVSVIVANGTIRSIEPLDPAPASLPWIAPGLIDLQVNGYAGTDFNAWPLAPGRRADLVLFHVSDGRFEIERVLVGNTDHGPDHSSP